MRAAVWILALLLAPSLLLCEEGTTGADILNTRVSARGSALGGAYASLGDDLSALTYNPAALASISAPSLDFLQFTQVDSVSLEDIAYGQHFTLGTVALGIVYQGQPSIANPQATDSPVVAWNLVVSAAYGVKLARWELPLPGFLQGADAGIALKYVQSHLGSYDAYTGAADLGVHIPLDAGVLFGASLLNVGPPIKFIAVADPLPTTALLGLSRAFAPLWNNQINVAADVDYPLQDTTRLHAGVEDWINETIALRVGYVFDTDPSLGGATFGFGAQLVQDGLTFHLDYALVPLYFQGFSSFESQNQFQLSLIF